MTFQYVLEHKIIRELDGKFDFLARIVLDKLLQMEFKNTDLLRELPFSLRQKYGYFFEDHEHFFTDSASVKELLVKMSSDMNFINGQTLIEDRVHEIFLQRPTEMLESHLCA